MARAYQEAHAVENLLANMKSVQAQINDLIQAKGKMEEKIKNLTTASEDLQKKNAELELRVKAIEHNNAARVSNSHLAQSSNPNHATLTPLHDLGTNKPIRQFPKHERDIRTMAQSQVIQLLQALDVKVLGMNAADRKLELRAQIGLPKESSTSGG